MSLRHWIIIGLMLVPIVVARPSPTNPVLLTALILFLELLAGIGLLYVVVRVIRAAWGRPDVRVRVGPLPPQNPQDQ